MQLSAHAETFWLNVVPPPLEVTTAAGYFQRHWPSLTGPGAGKDWLRRLPPKARREFSQLGRLRLRELQTNLPQVGGLARAATARRGKRGRFVRKGE